MKIYLAGTPGTEQRERVGSDKTITLILGYSTTAVFRH